MASLHEHPTSSKQSPKKYALGFHTYVPHLGRVQSPLVASLSLSPSSSKVSCPSSLVTRAYSPEFETAARERSNIQTRTVLKTAIQAAIRTAQQMTNNKRKHSEMARSEMTFETRIRIESKHPNVGEARPNEARLSQPRRQSLVVVRTKIRLTRCTADQNQKL